MLSGNKVTAWGQICFRRRGGGRHTGRALGSPRGSGNPGLKTPAGEEVKAGPRPVGAEGLRAGSHLPEPLLCLNQRSGQDVALEG